MKKPCKEKYTGDNLTGHIDRHTDSAYLSKTNTDCLKGVFAVCVLFHHLYQISGILRNSFIGVIFQFLGYLSVTMFFFYSGFGLMTSYMNKGGEYIKSFPRKRIIPFYCCCIILIVLYLGVRIAYGDEISVSLLIRSFTFGGTYIGNGWYLQVILLFYIIFYIVFSIKKPNKIKVLLMWLIIICYIVLCVSINLSSTWYITVFGFFIGVFWKYKHDELHIFFKGHYVIYYLTSMLILIILAISYKFINNAILKEVLIGTICVVSLIVVNITTYFIVNKINAKIINNRITNFLGKISFEIYVLQGIFLSVFNKEPLKINKWYFYYIVVVCTTILFALMLRPVINKIYSIFKNYKGKEKCTEATEN